jgi:hypothetical protein
MPLIRLDISEDYSDEKIKQLLNTIHNSVVTSFHVPERDRYHIVSKHGENELFFEDTGLGFERSERPISIQVFSRKRSEEEKQNFYKNVVRGLEKEGIDGKDVLISIFENGDADWSFGFGNAQFLTGELQ